MNYNKGDIISGVISGIKDYGVFIKFDETFGFCHISNCSYKFIKNLNEFFSIGNEIKAKIIEINQDNKINLSIKDCESEKHQIRQKSKFEKVNNTNKQQKINETIESKSSFDDMLKTYLKNSEERLECIGKRNQKHTKR